MTGTGTGPWVGRSVRRLGDPSILRGEGRYVADAIAGQDCLHTVFVRSPVAAGVLRAVQVPAGVWALTAAELASVAGICPTMDRPDYVPVTTPVLASDVVRFVGEPVAMVVAASPAEALDAAELVGVEIDRTPPVLSVADALRAGAPAVHDVAFPGEVNTVVQGTLTTPGFGDIFNAAATTVTVSSGSARQSALPIETRGSLADYEQRTGRVTLTTSTQMPHVTRTGICTSLGIPADLLRVVAPDVGGAFGQKMCLAREDIALVHAARQLRRAVAWVETREENLTASWHSREQQYTLTGAFDPDGRLLALRADIVADVGAYSCYPVTFGVEPLMALSELPGPYALEHYDVRARGVLTNKCPIAPYRGVSRPAMTLALERLMDTAAKQLGISPVQIRLRNLVREFPHTTPTGLVLDKASYVETMQDAVTAADLPGFRVRQQAAREQGRLLGIGLSVFAEHTGYGTPAFGARRLFMTPGYERVEITMDPSGGVVIRIGSSPHGQGLATTLAQIIADELGIAPEQTRVVHGDTDSTPFGWGTFASRSLVICGGAALMAARRLRQQLAAIAGELLDCDPWDLVFGDGRITRPGTESEVPIGHVAEFAYLNMNKLKSTSGSGLYAEAEYDPRGTFSNACHIAEVEVDPETGEVKILRFLVAEDAGRLINPAIADGQICGGVAQGIANALYEELVYDEDGNLSTASLMDYLPPTSAEIPPITIMHRETISDTELTGAKGIGEGGTIGAPAAVLSAISDAVSHLGVDVFQMPQSPHRLHASIQEAKQEGRA
ncbi:MAG: aerobic carbon-monoxide dehydrogenase large subunit [Streptosporangiaceae bacterium]|nr:aerobic carbon-monoxide dehydrogenase large subunit [Streptosporangiaceae bacterium]